MELSLGHSFNGETKSTYKDRLGQRSPLVGLLYTSNISSPPVIHNFCLKPDERPTYKQQHEEEPRDWRDSTDKCKNITGKKKNLPLQICAAPTNRFLEIKSPDKYSWIGPLVQVFVQRLGPFILRTNQDCQTDGDHCAGREVYRLVPENIFNFLLWIFHTLQ